MSAIDPGGAPAEGAPATATATTTTTEPAAGGAPETTAPAVDFAPVLDRVGEVASGLNEMRQQWGEFMQSQQPPETDPGLQAWMDAFGIVADPQVDQFGNPIAPQQPPAPQYDPQAFQRAVDAQVQQAIQPVMQTVTGLQQQQALAGLYERIPELAPVPQDHPDFATHNAARERAITLTQQSVAGYPPQIAQALLNDAGHIERVYKAAEADRLARAQVPAGGQPPAQLEAAGGAHPGGTGEQPSPVHEAFSQRVHVPDNWR